MGKVGKIPSPGRHESSPAGGPSPAPADTTGGGVGPAIGSVFVGSPGEERLTS